MAESDSLSRPRHFRVTAPGELILNLNLRPPVMCDLVGASPEEKEKVCWAEEVFQVPSADGVLYEVGLFNLHQYSQACSTVQTNGRHREFATYNLLSIEADSVAYHPHEQTLEASGNVLMEDEGGEHKPNSVRLRVQEGHVSALPSNR